MSNRRREPLSRDLRAGGPGPHDDRRWADHQEHQRFEELESELAAAREEHFTRIANGCADDCEKIAHPHVLALLRHRHR